MKSCICHVILFGRGQTTREFLPCPYPPFLIVSDEFGTLLDGEMMSDSFFFFVNRNIKNLELRTTTKNDNILELILGFSCLLTLQYWSEPFVNRVHFHKQNSLFSLVHRDAKP